MSNVSQFIRQLNASKSVCSTSIIKSNVNNSGVVIQLITPLDVGKSVSSNNVTKRYVYKVSSVNKLV